MTVSIPSEFAQFVDREIASGKFRSQEEVVAEALRLLRTREEKWDELRSDIEQGLDALDRGEFTKVSTAEDRAALVDRIRKQSALDEIESSRP